MSTQTQWNTQLRELTMVYATGISNTIEDISSILKALMHIRWHTKISEQGRKASHSLIQKKNLSSWNDRKKENTHDNK